MGVDVAADGTVFVADRASYRVQVYDSNGNYQSGFGERGGAPGQFLSLTSIAVGNEHVYVSDNRGSVHVFDKLGEFSHVVNMVDPVSNRPLRFIGGIDVDGQGRIYIVDELRGIHRFSSTGEHEMEFGRTFSRQAREGIGPGRFRRPADVTLDSNGNVYVVDTENATLSRFDTDGNLLRSSFGHINPTSVDVDNRGKLYVADWGIRVRSFDEAELPTDGSLTSYIHDGPFYFLQPELASFAASAPTIRELTGHTFLVPGDPGEDVMLEFSFASESGSLQFTMGVFEVDKVSADPTGDPQAYAEAVFAAGTAIFDERQDAVGATKSLTLPGGAEVGFFLLPGASLERFERFPEPFFRAHRPGVLTELLAPLYSVSNANPGAFDQMLAFTAEDRTLLSFEDLTFSIFPEFYGDFSDAVIVIDRALLPVPEPTMAGPLAVLCFILMWHTPLARELARHLRGVPS